MNYALVRRLRAEVARALSERRPGVVGLDSRRELARHLTLETLGTYAEEQIALGRTPPSAEEEQALAQAVLDRLFGLAGIQALIDDSSIESIDINGADQCWVTYADGRTEQVGAVADSDAELIDIVRSAAAHLGLSERRFDAAHPELDLRLPDGSRLSALMAVTPRPVVSIRRHRFVDLTLGDLTAMAMFDQDLASLLGAAVRAKRNIVVAGPMGAGKTTLLRALASEIPRAERLVTIEQAFELALEASGRHPNMVALEAREANTEGEGEITMRQLVRRSLRMNADRVIVGEVLGDEILAMLNAMSQGRSGSMCTIHADSSAGVFRRIAAYAVQAPERLPLEAANLLAAGALHFVVYISMRRGPAGVERFVSSVREVIDAEGPMVISNEVWRPGPDGRAVPGIPLRSETAEELLSFGHAPRIRSLA